MARKNWLLKFENPHSEGWYVLLSNGSAGLGNAESIARLPMMKTDVELRLGDHLTVLDCKFYEEAFTQNWATERYKTPNLYQLYAYVKNKQLEHPSDRIAGILLYPEVEKSFTDRFTLQGHPFTIASINLNQSWKQIHRELLEIPVWH